MNTQKLLPLLLLLPTTLCQSTSEWLDDSMRYAMSLFCSVCFMLCLNGLGSTKKAKNGNLIGMVGMFIAVLIGFTSTPYFSTANSALVDRDYFFWWLGVLIIAACVGLTLGKKVSMINLPQTIASFHSLVGLAALLVGIANFLKHHSFEAAPQEINAAQVIENVETFLAIVIGAITFVGSVIAALKLSDILTHSLSPKLLLKYTKPVVYTLGLILLALLIVMNVSENFAYQLTIILISLVLSLFLGFILIDNIGGADMPVVVSLLNSYSGWTTSAAGLMLNNSILVIAGALIGSSGLILSYHMCRSMNRTLLNVILPVNDIPVSPGPSSEKKDSQTEKVREASTEQMMNLLFSSSCILIIPGYGMAVSKCQNDVSQIVSILKKSSDKKKIIFGMHPVAGRMPGHMNVLLAEANIDYSIVLDMDLVNREYLERGVVDLCLVIGANDIVNPLSAEKGNSISGMPVLHAWKAKTTVVMKRSLATGYANLDNPLFYYKNNLMWFGNAKTNLQKLLSLMLQRGDSGTETTDSDGAVDSDKEKEKDKEKQLAARETSAAEPLVEKKPQRPLNKVACIVNEDFSSVSPSPSSSPTSPAPGPLRSMVASLSPHIIPKLNSLGFDVWVESGVGENSNFQDALYTSQGAKVHPQNFYRDPAYLSKIDLFIRLTPPSSSELSEVYKNKILLTQIFPQQNPSLVSLFSSLNITSLAIDNIPRISKAQKLDTRSSMANLAGYRAIIEAVSLSKKMSKAVSTASGTFPPMKVFIIGAGVAGLQACLTAKSLGCIVYCTDSRKVTKEQVESCGGIFVAIELNEEGEGAGGYAKQMTERYLDEQRRVYAEVCRTADIVVTTAVIPGVTAPKLISEECVSGMMAGSVIVDLASEFGDKANGWGGNCELTKQGQVYVDPKSGVSVIGYTDLAYRVASQASLQWSNNVGHLLEEIEGDVVDEGIPESEEKGMETWKEGLKKKYDEKDAIVEGVLMTLGSDIYFKGHKDVKKELLEKTVEDERKGAPVTIVVTQVPVTTPAAPAAPAAPVEKKENPSIFVKTDTRLLEAPSCTSNTAGSPTPPIGGKMEEKKGELEMEKAVEISKERKELYKKLKIAACGIIFFLVCIVLGRFFTVRQCELFLVFALAILCGYHIIKEVSHSLHTPLMSVTNALSGIIVLGAMSLMDPHFHSNPLYSYGISCVIFVFSIIAIAAAFFNIFAAFCLTHRMLKMFVRT